MKTWMRATLALAGGSVAFALLTSLQTVEPLQPYPLPITSQVPGDINVQELNEFNQKQQFDQAQRMFDIFAWQAFIGLNWPATPDGQPDNSLKIGQPSPNGVVWDSWKHDYQVYTADGQPPQLSAIQNDDESHTIVNFPSPKSRL